MKLTVESARARRCANETTLEGILSEIGPSKTWSVRGVAVSCLKILYIMMHERTSFRAISTSEITLTLQRVQLHAEIERA